jgi:hypothetical protein
MRVFEGKWEGQATASPATASARGVPIRTRGRFLSARNKSTYEPKTPSTKPEIHEDIGMFSYDRTLKKIVLRQFHAEGFVNEYTLDSLSSDGKRLDFVTVRIENIPPGWRAKESYQVISSDEIVETFYLAGPGKDFERYSETRLKRTK